MRIGKKLMVFISIFCCLLAFFIPFIFSNCNDSLISVLSTSFTALGAIATLFTLFIALMLYQKFGIESRFIERQTDKTLELVDIIKGKVIYIGTNRYKHFLRFSIDDKKLKKNEFYNYMKSKTIIIMSDDYQNFVKPLLEIRKSYWLPNVIKEKMKFLEYYGFECEIENPKDELYARMYFNAEKGEKYVLPFPKMTVEEYINKKNELSKSIEKWLSKHSDIKIDLKLEEPNQQMV